MKRARLPLLLAAVAFLSACEKQSPAPADHAAALPPVAVRLGSARLEQLPVLIETTGTVRPVQRAVIAAKVMGTIESLPLALGQRVRAGDLLAQLSAAEISARVLQARSQLNLVRRDLDRERDLFAKGAGTRETVKALEDRLATADAVLREAEAMLSYTTLVAPFDGVVSRRIADAGMLATPGQPLLELEGSNLFEIEADIPDSLAPTLAPGTALTVQVPAAALAFTGALAEISSAADPIARSVSAKISVPAGTAVRSGQFARVQLPAAPAPTLLIPASALTPFGQMERVFVAVDGRARLRLVKTGATRASANAAPEQIEILAGLDNGEQVILAPPPGLRDGQRITVAR